MSNSAKPDHTQAASTSNFIRSHIEADLAAGRFQGRGWAGQPGAAALHANASADPAAIRTRFPPEPNGYLHLGHAKSICLNFGLAQHYNGACHLRFDDTNPEKEEQQYVDSIEDVVQWLGFDWRQHLYFASNYFDFMYSAAEYLISEKYTSPSYLAVQGGSNGGLLIGAVVNQRPELFKVAFPQVGVMDMLRFHKFTVGWGWVVEYGSSDTIAHFKNLYGYSPIHNIKPANYPAVMVTTADHDDRVVPAHSFKYIATLQENQKGTNPVLIRVDVKAGHGAGKPLSKTIEEVADMYSFMLYNMGVTPKW